jgi:cysteine desulfurase
MERTTTRGPIYLDHNASTPVAPEVRAAMEPYLGEHFGNPSSSHAYGRHARAAVDEARAKVAAAIGARPEEIVFTSGGTEANNLAITGTLAARPEPVHIVTSSVEHPATSEPCRHLERKGARVTRVGVDRTGVVDVGGIERALLGKVDLVTIIHAHNETGVIQPILEIASRAHARSALVHADAAQSVGKIAVRVDDLDVDLLSIAGHKLGAPKGIGALYVRSGTRVEPLMRGAGHERGLRPGTENVASIVGLGMACTLVVADLDPAAARMRGLRERLWSALAEEIRGVARNGEPERVLPNTLSIRLPRVSGAEVLAHASELAASTGSACHDGHDVGPAAIVAMGVPAEQAVGTIRLSLGRGTTAQDVDEAVRVLGVAWRLLG